MSGPAATASSVGSLLRATRQRHGLAVRDVATSLRIRAPYIDAIEDGRFADLPAPAYAVGFVKGYAKALGLDEAEILRRFRAEADGAQRHPELSFPAPVPDRGVPAGAVALVGMVLAGLAYGAWWNLSGTTEPRLADQVAAVPTHLAAPPPPAASIAPPITMPATESAGAWSRPAAEPQAVIPPVVSVPASAPNPNAAQAAMPLPAAQAVPQGATPGTLPEGMYGALPNEESRVLVRARGETWIQVRDRASGTVVFNRTLKPGEAYRAPMKPGLVLTMGNAPGTDVLVDGAVVPNPFPAVSVRRDIALEPDRVREGLAAAPVVVRAPPTPSAPATQAAPTPPPFTWAN